MKTKPPSEADAKGSGESANRRRLGKVVHDDRGCASVEWEDAPQNYVRPVLEVEDSKKAQNRLKTRRDKAPLTVAKQDPFNPYQRMMPDGPAARGSRRDLRQLSKWIKMMREIEERKLLDKEEAEKPRED